MHGHGATVVVNVVAALAVGEDLDPLDETGGVWWQAQRVGGVRVSDSEGDLDRLGVELSASYSARGSIPAASAVEYHSVRTPAIRRFRKARPAPQLRSERGRLRGFGLGVAFRLG